jgi:hypothetical protein
LTQDISPRTLGVPSASALELTLSQILVRQLNQTDFAIVHFEPVLDKHKRLDITDNLFGLARIRCHNVNLTHVLITVDENARCVEALDLGKSQFKS